MKVLVIGASTKPSRPSNRTINLLQTDDHEVLAIGRTIQSVGAVTFMTGFPELEDIHTVTLYINKTIQEDYYDYIIGLRPDRVIFNPGTENVKFSALLEEARINYLEACTLVMLSVGSF